MKARSTRLFLSIVCLILLPLPGKHLFSPAQEVRYGITIIESTPGRVVLELSNPGISFLPPTENLVLPEDGFSRPGHIWQPGKPQLPVYAALIGLPVGGEAELVVLDDSQELIHQVDIPPAPTPAALRFELTPGEFELQEDPSIYDHDGYFPLEPVVLGEEAWLRDQQVVRIEFFPFQYNPVQRKLLWHKMMRVVVSWDEPALSEVSLRKISYSDHFDPFTSLMEGALLNYNQARQWAGLPGNAVQRPYLPDPLHLPPGIANSRNSDLLIKIVVDRDGLYWLGWQDLQSAGIPASADPRHFRLTSQGQDIAMIVMGEEDGTFGPGDGILFYGQKLYGERLAKLYHQEGEHWMSTTQQLADGSYQSWQPSVTRFLFEQYTNENVYWLEVSNHLGLRMEKVDGSPSPNSRPAPPADQVVAHVEQQNRRWEYHFTSEDSWFWDRLWDTTPHTYTTTIKTLADGPFTATIRVQMVSFNNNAALSPDHHVQLWFNDPAHPPVNAYWNGRSRFTAEFEVPDTALVEGENQLVLRVLNDAASLPQIYFDWFEVEYLQRFQAQGNEFQFIADQAGSWKYEVDGFTTPSVNIFNITDPLRPVFITSPRMSGTHPNITASFETSHNAGEVYYLGGLPTIHSPKKIEAYQPYLRGPDLGADLVMISPAYFIDSAQKLANLRTAQGIRTRVIDLEHIYNEFNFGITHPLAIKNFLAFTFLHWQPPAPAYAILVGDGHWNLMGKSTSIYGSLPVWMPPHLSWVDPWQGEVDSTNLLATISGTDPLPDLVVARMPVQKPEELDAITQKMMTYEQTGWGDWQRRILFVADDTPDAAGDFVASSEEIIARKIPGTYRVDRIYLDDFQDQNLCGTRPFPGGPLCPGVNTAIIQTLSSAGALLLNYNGHASIPRWASEQILLYYRDNPSFPDDYDINDIASFDNGEKLPVVFSMTCLDGYWFHPTIQPSLAELFLNTPGRGAAAAFSPTGLGVAYGHDALQKGIYQAIFSHGIWNLGSIVLAGQVNLYSQAGPLSTLNTYTLFGDPSLNLANHYSFALEAPALVEDGWAGAHILHSLVLTNTGGITDTYRLTAAGSSWETAIQPGLLDLVAPGKSVEIGVRVAVPLDAAFGSLDEITITATSAGNSGHSNAIVLTTHLNMYILYLPYIPGNS